MAHDAQQVMLAHSWTEDSGIDPAGYWMSEKLVKNHPSFLLQPSSISLHKPSANTGMFWF